MSDTASAPRKAQPLSPHLSVYKLIPTMVMSIGHRITGAALYGGTVLVAWWLIATATGTEAFETFAGVAGSILGQIVLFGFTFALFQHMLGGIKHLVQDTGAALAREFTTKMAILHPILALALTVALWAVVWAVRSGGAA